MQRNVPLFDSSHHSVSNDSILQPHPKPTITIRIISTTIEWHYAPVAQSPPPPLHPP